MGEMAEKIICCHECDELLRIPATRKEGRLKCPRCGTVLLRQKKGMVEIMYALSIAAAILFLLTNYFPFLSFHVVGNTSHANFMTSIVYLFGEKDWLIGIAVLMTTVIVPMIRIGLMLSLFGPIYHGIVPPYTIFALKVLSHSLPWAMLDVFLVGVFVSMVKLVKMGTIIPGLSLWAFMVMVFVMAAMQVVFDPQPLWEKVDQRRREKGMA